MRRWTWVYGAVVLLFTVYTLLDTFVITRVYTVVEEEEETEETEENAVVLPTEEPEESTTATQMLETQGSTVPVITDTSYQDEDISITINYTEINQIAFTSVECNYIWSFIRFMKNFLYSRCNTTIILRVCLPI